MSVASNEESELLSNYQRCSPEIQCEIRELAAKNARTESEIEEEAVRKGIEFLESILPSQ